MTTSARKIKAQRPGAGFVVVRKFPDGWKVLGLRFYATYDLPKGGCESKDASILDTAIRECEEESSIVIDRDKDMPVGDVNLKLRHLSLFIAITSQDAKIRKNSQTGLEEHHGLKWLTFEEASEKMHPYLRPSISWAKEMLESAGVLS